MVAGRAGHNGQGMPCPYRAATRRVRGNDRSDVPGGAQGHGMPCPYPARRERHMLFDVDDLLFSIRGEGGLFEEVV